MSGLLALAMAWSLQVWIEMPPRPDQVAVPSDPDEVVVNGYRRRRLTLDVRRDKTTRAFGCQLRRPSGDAALDLDVCNAAVACTTGTPELRREMLEACLGPKLEAIIIARKAGRPVASGP